MLDDDTKLFFTVLLDTVGKILMFAQDNVCKDS